MCGILNAAVDTYTLINSFKVLEIESILIKLEFVSVSGREDNHSQIQALSGWSVKCKINSNRVLSALGCVGCTQPMRVEGQSRCAQLS